MSLRWLYPHVPHSFPTESFLPFSSPARTIIPLQLRAIWSHSVGVLRARWTTTCHWRLQMRRSCRARTKTPSPCILHSPAHPAPPTTIGWKAKAAHPSKSCRMTSALAGRAYSSAGQAASALHSMAVLQVFQAKLLHSMDESNLEPRSFQRAAQCDRPGPARHQNDVPGNWQIHGPSIGARAPPVVEPDGDEGCG